MSSYLLRIYLMPSITEEFHVIFIVPSASHLIGYMNSTMFVSNYPKLEDEESMD